VVGDVGHEVEHLAQVGGDGVTARPRALLAAEVPELGARGEAVEGGHERQHEAVHAVEVGAAALVVDLPVLHEVGKLGLPGVALAVGEQALRLAVGVAVQLFQVVMQVVIGMVSDR